MEDNYLILIYIVPVLLLFLWKVFKSSRDSRRHRETLRENIEAGLTLPSSLHPSIDPAVCIGCGSCVTACPEGNVLGMIDDRVALVNPTNCIGHGACAKACPVGGITLVFGSAERGVSIPRVDPNFQSNVEGIYLVGEVGGMGLIRNAMSQGRQAVEHIAQQARSDDASCLDVLIIGAGPAGLAASVTAKHEKLNYRTIEQEKVGGTVAHYPRAKLVMTQAVQLPGVAKFKLGEIRKENLLQFWLELIDQTGIEIHYQERFEKLINTDQGFRVITNQGEYCAKHIVVAIGQRGTPRKLGVEGEELAKVVYRLTDPEQYRGQQVLVVGGGDSAVEAACSIAEEPGTGVSLSYRGASFNRVKLKNRQRMEGLQQKGMLAVLLESNVVEIAQDHVVIEQQGKQMTLQNDVVIINAGGVLPTVMLQELGIEIETKYGTA